MGSPILFETEYVVEAYDVTLVSPVRLLLLGFRAWVVRCQSRGHDAGMGAEGQVGGVEEKRRSLARAISQLPRV